MGIAYKGIFNSFGDLIGQGRPAEVFAFAFVAVAGAGSAEQLAVWNSGSTEPTNNTTTFAVPGVNPNGRWSIDPSVIEQMLMFFNAIDVANAAVNLPQIDDTTLPNGQLAWDEARKVYWSLDRTITIPPASSPQRIIATKSGTGTWLRLPETSSIFWNVQHDWYLDPANSTGTASDTNSGIAANAPLLTGTELFLRLQSQNLRREAPGPFVQNWHLLSDGLDSLTMEGFGADQSSGIPTTINVIGAVTTTIVGPTALSSAVALSRAVAPGSPVIIQSAALPSSWTAAGAVGKRIRITVGATLGTATIMVDDGGGNHQAQCTPFIDANGAEFTPGNTDTFVVENITKVKTIVIDENAAKGGLIVVLNDVEFDDAGPTHNSLWQSGKITANRCRFGNNGQALTVQGTCSLTAIGGFFGTGVVTTIDSGSFTSTSAGHNADVVRGKGNGSTVAIGGDTYMLEATLITNEGYVQPGNVYFNNVNKPLITARTGATTASQGGRVEATGVIYGKTTNAGGVLTGNYSVISLNGNVPKFTSNANHDFVFGSANVAIAQLPFVDEFNVGGGPVAGANMAGAFS